MDLAPTISFARQNVFSAITLVVLVFFSSGMSSDIDEIRGDINEMRGDINGVRGDIDGVRQDIDGMRQDMSREHAELRAEMYEEHTGLRTSIAKVSERLVRVETTILNPSH